MYTRGFASEYAKELSEKSGANIALLTDFDPAGVMMGIDLSEVERIGIDFETLEYLFGLEPYTMAADSRIVTKLEEEYEQVNVDSHLVSLRNSRHPSVDYFMPDPNSKVRKRIEIDSVLKEVGNERFWDFVIHELIDLFPTRDYNRVIDVDDIADVYTDEMFQLQKLVINLIKDVTAAFHRKL